jgi:hypothetical protein
LKADDFVILASMKLKLIIFLFSLLFAGCSVASPLTTTNEWLDLLKEGSGEKAKQLMLFGDSKTFEEEFMINNGKLIDFSVSNAIPLSSEELKKYQVDEGNMVYYRVKFENGEEKYWQNPVVKKDGAWKVVWK